MTQNSKSDLQVSFNKSLVGGPALDAAIDLVEMSIDELVSSDLVKNIPVVKTFVGLMQTGANIQDRLFLKKILSFLKGIDEVPEKARRKILNDIDNSAKYRIHVGEKILYLISACEDHTVSELLARLFTALVTEEISYDDFLKAAHVIAKNQSSTILDYISADNEVIDMYKNDVDIETGLYVVYSEKVSVSVHDNDDWKYDVGGYIAEVGDGGLWANPSKAGEIIKRVLTGDKK